MSPRLVKEDTSLRTIVRSRFIRVQRDRPFQTLQSSADPYAGKNTSNLRAGPLVRVGLACVALLFAARCWAVAQSYSITSDETTHLVRSIGFWMTGRDQGFWQLGSAPLPHLAYGLSSYIALRAAGELPEQTTEDAITAVVVSGNPRVLLPARAIAIVLGLALLAGVYAAGRLTAGPLAGLAAAAVCSLIPEVIAHSSIAGSDGPFAGAATWCTLALAWWTDRPSWRRWLLVSVAVGIAWATRHAALILLALAAVVRLFHSIAPVLQSTLHSKQADTKAKLSTLDRLASDALAITSLTTLAFIILWACEGFEFVKVSEIRGEPPGVGASYHVGPLDLSNLPVPTSLVSVLKQVRHQAAGHEAYFLGEHGDTGWLAYSPVAFLLKTPCGLIALMALAAARPMFRAKWDLIALACVTLLWITLLRSHVNIGLRYALLTYPIAAVWIGRYLTAGHLRDPVRAVLAIAAIAWLSWASAAAHPHYLSSFNELGGGPSQGWRYLADSNIDWGQDFDELAQTLPRVGIDAITYDLSSERRLNLPGVFAVRNAPRAEQIPFDAPPNRRVPAADGSFIGLHTRYIAVSVSRLMGLYSQNDLSWLRTRDVVARVGDSIFIFDMDNPSRNNMWLD